MATFIKAGFWEQLCKPCRGYKGWLNLDQLITSLLPAPAYRVYTALLTQSGGDNSVGQTSGTLIIGTTYYISNDCCGADFTNVGAPNNNLGTYFIATGEVPNAWGGIPSGDPQLTYNTGAPVATVLENTIGNVWWTYDSVGNYSLWSDNLFGDKPYIMVAQSVSAEPPYNIVYTYYNQNNRISLYVTEILPPYSNIDGVLSKSAIEIRVYN